MKKLNIIVALLLFPIMFSCFKDKGNYEYSEINEITIKGLPETKISYFRNSDTLKVSPEIISTANHDDSRYEYQWVAIQLDPTSGKAGTSYDIGNTRDLKYFITLPKADYNVYCKVKDIVTDVVWRESFSIKVTTLTNEGWMVLQDYKGDSRLDLISLPGGAEIYLRDILKEYDIPYIKGPRKISLIADMYNSYAMLQTVVMTDGGTTHLNKDDLSWDVTLDYVYEFGAALDKVVCKDIVYWYMTGINVVVDDNNDLYLRRGYPGKLYIDPINNIKGVPFKVAPFVGTLVAPYSQATVYYDMTNQQFVQMLPNNLEFKVCDAPETQFTFKTGKDMAYMGNTMHDKGRCYAILKDNESGMWLYAMKINTSSAFAQVPGYHYQINSTEIANAKHFAFHPTLPYLFYATDDKLYQFDMADKVSKEIVLPNAGEKITFLKFNMMTAKANSATHKKLQDMLIVGSYNPNGEDDKNGVIRLYDAPSNISADIVLYREYLNFAKPVDIAYKEVQ